MVTEQEEWDFYPCRVDDGPASISLNLSLIHQLDELPENTLYAVRVAMADPAAHGMGGDDEAEVMYPVEDQLSDAARPHGLRFIGRLRNNGGWQLTFMGAPELEPRLRELAQQVLAAAGREFSLVSKHDPEWKYYTGFLYPEPERMRWIQDRRVVDVLQQHGDPLTTKRRVDHWAYFSDEGARGAFLAAVAAHGFEAQLPASTDDDFAAHVHRVDSVALDDIHDVTTLLEELAEKQGGEYDGWETSVEAPPPN